MVDICHGKNKDLESPMATDNTNSICDDMTKLWEEGPGSIADLPSSFVHPDSSVQRKRTLVLRFWLCFMVLTGGSMDFAVGIFDDFVKQAGYSDAGATFVVTFFAFLGSAVPPTLDLENLRSLRDVNAKNPYFKYKIMLPGLADFAITTLRFAAMQFVSPAIVSMLKCSSQLVGLAFVQHFRGKRLNVTSGLCVLFCVVGQVLVTYSTLMEVTIVHGNKTAGMKVVGIVFAFASGILGSFRNVAEEMILQGDDLTAGGLLLSESWISLTALLIISLVKHLAQGDLQASLLEVYYILSLLKVWIVLVLIMFCGYSKDFGKLFVVKHGTAMIAKVSSMMFPIVTWVLALVTFFGTDGQYGEGLEFPSSAIRMTGFVVIGFASVKYVVSQKKK